MGASYTSERSLPHDLNAETCVLGCCIVHPEAVPTVLALLRPEDLYLPRHAAVLRAIFAGIRPLVDAAREAGLHPVPSLRTLLREVIAKRLDLLLIAGRLMTSPATIVRWVAAQQQRKQRAGDRP